MIKTDEDALICDFAETYHVLDYRALPVSLAAVLASGLRENSRIRMKMSNVQYVPPEIVLPKLADEVALFRYGFTEDAKKKRNFPALFTKEIYKKPDERNRGYASGEEFMAARARIVEEINHG